MQLITSDESRSVYIMTGKENCFGKVVITSELICTAIVVPTKLTYFSLEAHICVYVLPPPVSYFENWKLIGQSWYYIGVCVCMCVCVGCCAALSVSMTTTWETATKDSFPRVYTTLFFRETFSFLFSLQSAIRPAHHFRRNAQPGKKIQPQLRYDAAGQGVQDVWLV